MTRSTNNPQALSPLMSHQGALIRPGELLVELVAEPGLRDRLQAAGGRLYKPGPPGEDWRTRPGAPDYGDVNERFAKLGLKYHLWVGFSEKDTLELGSLPGTHFNTVYTVEYGVEDFYQGGPDGVPDVAGPGPALSAGSVDTNPDVTVMDTGMPAQAAQWHPNLVTNRFDQGPNVPVPSPDPLDTAPPAGVLDPQAGHGLFISGLIAKAASQVDIEMFRILDEYGKTDDTILCPALGTATAPVINLSFGGFTWNNQVSQPLCDALKDVLDVKKKVVVAAAGNFAQVNPGNRPVFPAAYPHDYLIAVGAYNNTVPGSPTLWPKSSPGEVYAPGVNLLSTYVAGWAHPVNPGQTFTGWATWSGTSFAAPLVAAEIARQQVLSGGSVRAVTDTFLSKLPGAPWSGKLYTPVP